MNRPFQPPPVAEVLGYLLAQISPESRPAVLRRIREECRGGHLPRIERTTATAAALLAEDFQLAALRQGERR